MYPLPLCSPYLPSYPPQLPPFYFPTLLYLHTFSNDFLFHPNAPIHIVYQPCPPTPHFCFFGPFLAIPLLPVPSPTIQYLLQLISKAFYPLLDPSYPPTPACPPPAPIFTFLNNLWTLFCMNFCSYLHIHVHTLCVVLNTRYLTAFFGCYQLPG